MSKLVKSTLALPVHVVADRVIQRLLEAEKALGVAVGIDQVKLVMDVAAAQEVFAKRQQLGDEVIGFAHTIKIRALSKLGELLKTLDKAKGGAAPGVGRRGKNAGPEGTRIPTFADLGVSKKVALVAQQLAALPHATREAIAQGEQTLAQVKRAQGEQENRRALSTKVAVESQTLGVHHGDFRKLAPSLVKDNSAQLVFTDPPYDEESVELYEAAAKEAARVLMPGGSFLAYSGQKYLAQAMTACAQHLTYWWLFALIHEGQHQLLQKLGVRCGWKPILWFVKKTRGDVAAIIPDIVQGGGREKDQHEWQQGEAEAADLIARLTHANDLVVDFMAGSGTITAAAKKLDRRVIAFELRADHVEKIAKRIA